MRILCIGNSSESTDQLASTLARDKGLINHGLLSDLDGQLCFASRVVSPGVYHTSFVDLCFDRVQEASAYFDRICVLDQPLDQWRTTTEFYDTINYALRLDRPVEWQNEHCKNNFLYWKQQIDANKSLCIWPFIQMNLSDSYANLCCVSSTRLAQTTSLRDFNNQTYSTIRQKMLAGEQIPHCQDCYNLESRGIESARIQQTLEWTTRLGLATVNNLQDLTSPRCFEIILDNTCNLQCRMCYPSASSLIEKEYRTLGILHNYVMPTSSERPNHLADVLQAERIDKLYVTGGEPTANARVYDFLEQCVSQQRTDFLLQINTNAWKISSKFLELASHFRRIEFIVSLDAFGPANDYIRWPSRWDIVNQNVSRLKEVGVVSFNVSLSLYGIFSFPQLMAFLDNQYPGHYVHCQFVHNQSPFMVDHAPELIQAVSGIKQLDVYKNIGFLQSFVDGLVLQMAQSTPNQLDLAKFFAHNDMLDVSRQSRLADYIPELEQLRHRL